MLLENLLQQELLRSHLPPFYCMNTPASIPSAVLLALCLIGLALPLRAQFTATYSFNTAATDVPTVANVSFSALDTTNVTLIYTAGFNTSTSGWVTNGVVADTSEYVSLSFQASPGYMLDLTSLAFKESRSASGPANMSVAFFIAGDLQETSTPFTTTSGTTATSSMSEHTFDFVDASTIPASSIVEFRFYGWGGSNVNGTLRLDDISVSGAVHASAIPEPSGYAAISALLTGFVAIVRRKRQALNALAKYVTSPAA